MSGSAHPAATTSAPCAFRREDHLQQLVRVFKKISEFTALRAQRFRRQLRRHLDSRHRRIFRHVANLIHLDASVATQRGLKLLGKGRRLCISTWESAHESRELRLRHSRRKVNAGNTGRSQQVREASFARRRSQRHAIEQNLSPRSAQQHTAPAAFIQRLAQLFPRGFDPPRVSVLIRVGLESCPSSVPFYSIVLLLTADSPVFFSHFPLH